MRKEVVKVLLIEDNPKDAQLIQIKLAKAGTATGGLPRFNVEWVTRLDKGLARLAAGGIDIILTDLALLNSRAAETFTTLQSRFPQLPIVVLTGHNDEELAQRTIQAGAKDYLFKRDVTGVLLAHTLKYARERQRAQEHTAKLAATNAHLQRELGACKHTMHRGVYLNKMLYAARNLTHLLAQKTGRPAVFQQSCESLVVTFGFHGAWLGLIADSGEFALVGYAGFDNNSETSPPKLANLPRCGKAALGQSTALIITAPRQECRDCPLARYDGPQGALVQRLESRGKTQGLMAISMPAQFAEVLEIQELFADMTSDIASALEKWEPGIREGAISGK